MKIDFRPAFMKDFDGCWTVINEAREQMIKSGRHQWTEQYPAYKGHPGRHQQRQCLCAHRERPDSRLRSGGAERRTCLRVSRRKMAHQQQLLRHTPVRNPAQTAERGIRTHFHQQGVQPVRSGARAQHQGGHQLRQPAHGEPALVYGILPLWKGELW